MDTLSVLKNRKSIRNFTGESISRETVNQIVEAAQQASTSINAQQTSIVIIENKETIQTIAEITGGKPQVAAADHVIAVVLDFNRTNEAFKLVGKEQVVHTTLEGLLVGAVDAGIMVEALQVAATALGVGTTVIGGIRNQPQAMIDLLGLPEKTFPIVGLTLGVIDTTKEPQVKPRVPVDSFAFYEKYDTQKVAEGVATYDKTLRQWWDVQNMTQMPAYIDAVTGFYSKPYYVDVKPTAIKQGFELL